MTQVWYILANKKLYNHLDREEFIEIHVELIFCHKKAYFRTTKVSPKVSAFAIKTVKNMKIFDFYVIYMLSFLYSLFPVIDIFQRYC